DQPDQEVAEAAQRLHQVSDSGFGAGARAPTGCRRLRGELDGDLRHLDLIFEVAKLGIGGLDLAPDLGKLLGHSQNVRHGVRLLHDLEKLLFFGAQVAQAGFTVDVLLGNVGGRYAVLPDADSQLAQPAAHSVEAGAGNPQDNLGRVFLQRR